MFLQKILDTFKKLTLSSICLLFLCVVTFLTSCEKEDTSVKKQDTNWINVGNVVYNESEKVFYNEIGEVLDLEKIKNSSPNENALLKATSITVISSTMSNNQQRTPKSLNAARSPDSYAYIVNLDVHIWWGADQHDRGGDIGADSQSFIFRPGNLHMTGGTFKYSSTASTIEARLSRQFLYAVYEDDPTETVTLTQNFSGPVMQYPYNGPK